MKLSGESKRACIYFLYDKEGIVDRYVYYALKEMKKNVDFLHCVINGQLQKKYKEKLAGIVDEVYERENIGNDIGAYKAAIEHIGWDKLSTFDELIIMNFTCFGPVYPFEDVFLWANEQDVDVWGLTWDKKTDWMGDKQYLHKNSKQYFFQSYFCGIRKPLLGSDFLEKFYKEIPENASYLESGNFYEYAFPGYFEEHGYKGAVFCDDLHDINYPLLNNPVGLLKKYHMPLIKKRSFFHHYTDILTNTGGEATSRLLHYLKDNTNYDVNMIWESILRLYSLSDIVRCASLNRVISDDAIKNISNEKIHTGLLFVATDKNAFDEDIEYFTYFPSDVDILIITDSEEKKEYLASGLLKNNIDALVKVVETSRSIEFAALLIHGKKFVQEHELICFAHDREKRTDILYSIENSYDYRTKETMFGSKAYINNIINLFKQEDRLGIAFSSAPNDNFYGMNVGNAWCGYYDAIKKFIDKLKLNVKTNMHTLCVAPIDSCFWFRTDALKLLINGIDNNGWKEEIFEREDLNTDIITRSCAYVAQANGYYPCYLYNSRLAEFEITNLEFYKMGNCEMRAWVDLLTLDAIGYKKIEEIFHKKACDVTRDEVIEYYYPSIVREKEYNIKESLRMLSNAVKRKYPKLWKILLPVRAFSRKVLI